MTDPTHYSGKLPEYVCHKTVRAAKIHSIKHIASGAELELVGPDGKDLGVFVVPLDFKMFTTMRPGWYLVNYEDGYVSASPAQAFEAGYTVKDAKPAKTPKPMTWERLIRRCRGKHK